MGCGCGGRGNSSGGSSAVSCEYTVQELEDMRDHEAVSGNAYYVSVLTTAINTYQFSCARYVPWIRRVIIPLIS